MPHKPRFKSHLRVHCIAPDLVFFLSESGYRVLQGELPFLIAPLVNGQNTAADIVKKLKTKVSRFDVECGLLLLEEEGCVTFSSTNSPGDLDSLRDALQLDSLPPAGKLNLNLHWLANVPIDPFRAAMKKLGMKVNPSADFMVAIVDNYLCDDLATLNRSAIRTRKRWMPAKPSGTVWWFGPVFRPPETACWKCLSLRLQATQRAEAFVAAHNGVKTVESPSLYMPGTFEAAIHFAALEIFKAVLSKPDTQATPTLLTLDITEMKLQRHMVMRLDDCPECCKRRSQHNKPIEIALQPRKKTFSLDAGHRSQSPDITFEKYEKHISPLTGIVDAVRPYNEATNGIAHSYVAGHIFMPRLKKEDLLQRGLVQQSGGKGMTAQQARTSALCEALERYSGMFRGSEYRITASFKELGNEAIHPNACMNFSEWQYSNRERWNRTNSNHDWIPEPFDEQQQIDWTPVWSLTRKRFRYLPTAYCYYGYPQTEGHRYCRADSNGNAAGNNAEEAILHGFFELVERDATAIWWFNRIRRPALDLDNFCIPYVKALQDYYKSIDRSFWVLDLTHDFEIPSFAAISRKKRSQSRQFLTGFGSHFDASIALVRAITEMNQFLPAVLSGQSSGVLQPDARNVSFLFPDPKKPPVPHKNFSNRSSNDFRIDVRTCVKIAQRHGLETFVLNQTRTDVGLPVFKVIVPGMRQFWPRFAPGRLYEVPVNLGWRKTMCGEQKLNRDRIVI